MVVERLILIILQFSAATVVFFLSIAAWRKRSTAGAPALYLSLCMLAITVYTFGYTMELASNSLESIQFWVRYEHWGIQAVAPLWLLFALAISGKEKLITPKFLAALFFFPVIFLAISQTLGSLNLAHPNPRLDTSGPFPTFNYDRSIFTYIALLYTSLCLAVSTYLFTTMYIRSAPTFRDQTIFFWVGSLIPWAAGFIYHLDLIPHNIDPIPLTLSLSASIYLLGFYRFRMLDIVPLARDMILEGMKEGVIVLDTRDRIIDINQRITGMLPNLNKRSVGLQAIDVLAEVPALVKLLKMEEDGSVEFSVVVDEDRLHYRAVILPLKNRRKQVIGRIITVHDNTHVWQLLVQLEELATHDSLTGVYNIRYFSELAEKELYRSRRYRKPVSIIMFDLDEFKHINDRYGHQAGDAVLKEVAKLCRGLLRKSDILGRYGGEEFIVLLPETNPSVAEALAKRLCAALDEMQVLFENEIIRVHASFGVTGLIPPRSASFDELLRSVDRNMYQAKAAGRNQVYVSVA